MNYIEVLITPELNFFYALFRSGLGDEEYNKMTSQSKLAFNYSTIYKVCAIDTVLETVEGETLCHNNMLHEGWNKRKKGSRAGERGTGVKFVKEVEKGRKDGVRGR